LEAAAGPDLYLYNTHPEEVHYCPQKHRNEGDILLSNEKISAASIIYGGVLLHGLHGAIYAWYMPTLGRLLPLLIALAMTTIWPRRFRTNRRVCPYQNEYVCQIYGLDIFEDLFCPTGTLYRFFHAVYLTATLQFTLYYSFHICQLALRKKRAIIAVIPSDPWSNQIPFLFVLATGTLLWDSYHTDYVYSFLLPIYLIVYNLENGFFMHFGSFLWQVLRMCFYMLFAAPVYFLFKKANESVAQI